MSRKAHHAAEVELKFVLDQNAAEEVSRNPCLAGSKPHVQSQCSVYFDTPEAALKRRGYSLRVRRVGHTYTQTLKARGNHAGLFHRAEWEMPVSKMQPELDLFARTPIKKWKGIAGTLVPGVRTDVERTVWEVHQGDDVIEVALDAGEVRAGGKVSVFHELELERKKGASDALFYLARALFESAPLRLGVLTKLERGERLADGEEGAEKAPALRFDRGMTVEQVFVQIFQSCIRQFRLNERDIVEQCDDEALHQARIAMRRLRGALTLFRPAIRRSTVRPWRNELRWLAASLTDARDIDVFLAGHDDMARRDRRKLKVARRAAYQEAEAAIDSARLRGLMLDLIEWIAVGDWQKPEAEKSIEKFAVRRLDLFWERVGHDAADLSRLDDEELHRLRIRVKKLRYAVEFLHSLYGKKARKFAAKLAQIQDRLGEMRDAAVAKRLAERLSVAVAIQAQCGRSDEQRLAVLQRDFKAIRRIGRFWS